MKRFIRKSLLRPRDRGELGALYLACFLLVTFLQFLERRAAGSETLVRYLRFIIDNQIAFVLIASAVVAVLQYQMVVRSRQEMRCRILVGDRLSSIRFRYAVECLAMLMFCCFLALSVNVVLGFSIVGGVYLAAALAVYAIGSTFFLGVQ